MQFTIDLLVNGKLPLPRILLAALLPRLLHIIGQHNSIECGQMSAILICRPVAPTYNCLLLPCILLEILCLAEFNQSVNQSEVLLSTGRPLRSTVPYVRAT